MKTFIVMLLCLFSLFGLVAQECKVLLRDIDKSYQGDCKKGKANGIGTAKGIDSYTGEFKKGYPEGKGTYIWSNGDIFKGFFKKGKKDGAGRLTFKTANKDSIITGFWRKDVYAGLFEKPYKKIETSPNITNIRFTKLDDDIKKVRLYIREDNNPVRSPIANIVIHHGQFLDIRNQKDFIEITQATFPLKFRATYNNEFFEIEIFQSGNWNVQVIIENINGLVGG